MNKENNNEKAIFLAELQPVRRCSMDNEATFGPVAN
jgi:hypothetical protein